MLVELLVLAEGSDRGKVSAWQPAPGVWGRKECPPTFTRVMVDVPPAVKPRECRWDFGRNVLVTSGGTLKRAEWERPIDLPAPDGKPQVVIYTPGLNVGGAEQWVLGLVDSLDKDTLTIRGVGVENSWDDQLLAKARQRCCVATGRGPSWRLIAGADVLIYWGSVHLPSQLPECSIFCSHSANPNFARHVPEVLARGSYLTAVSRAAADIFPKPENVTVLHNGVDLKRLRLRASRQLWRNRNGIRPDHIVLGYVGRISPEKRPELVARAARAMGAPYRAVVVGAASTVAGQRVEACLRGRVRPPLLLPETDRVADVYSGIDCLMLPSRWEGFSMTMIEAWLMGVPVVSTRVGAVDELEREHGRLVVSLPDEPADADLVAAVEEATQASEGRNEMVDRAFKLAHREFTQAAMGRRWTEFILHKLRWTA